MAANSLMQADMARLRPVLSAMDVLIVDDSRDARKILVSCLRAFGVTSIREAEHGHAGLEAAVIKAPDLILSDWEMKPMNGAQFIRELRRDMYGKLARTKVVMVTGHSEMAVVRDALDAGAHNFLVKPIQPAKLFEKLKAVIADRRAMVLQDGRWKIEAPKPAGVPGAPPAKPVPRPSMIEI
jgi:two-component system, chemotaxis family, chemotaxis protein CheY